MVRNITDASEQYRNAVKICRDVLAAAGKQFVEPKGVQDLLKSARKLFGEDGNETQATKEVEHAREWLIGIATKYLRGGILHFEGRIKVLSFMSLDQDIMDDMHARLQVFREVMRPDLEASLEQQVASFSELSAAVNNARAEQIARNEERERLAHQEVERQEASRRQRRLELERQKAEAETAARATREKQFDELFA